jgi:hypothetical protein
MTMSDNTYDWDSCMSWVSEGCYRQGTVEMMNSPCVVVAYLAGNEEMKINGNSWNSKKWRELFIVNRDVITSIKDYPYNNESLTREIVKWIKELAEKNLGWTYTEPTDYDYNNHSFHLNHINSNIQLVFSTNNMYNDFGHIEKHYGCINNQLDRNKLFKKNSYDVFTSLCLEVEYSGASQCMVCGELDPKFDSGSCLACSDCQPVFRCTCCGDIITGEPVIVDEEILCEWCAENRVHECVGCGEIHYLDNVQPIYVIPRTNEEHEEVMKDAWKINHSYLDTNDSDIIGYIYKNDCHRAFICKNDENNCIESFIEEYMNEGERPHHRSFEWYDECICVYFDQLNDSGREAFEVWNYENNEDFLDSFFNFNIYATTHIKHL